MKIALRVASMAGFLGVVLAGSVRAAPGRFTERPLSDLRDGQGPYWVMFTSPEYVAQGRYVNAVMDITGVAPLVLNEVVPGLGDTLQTRMLGRIVEEALPDGLARVTIEVNTKNAFAFKFEGYVDENGEYREQYLFGRGLGILLAGGRVDMLARGNCHMVWEYINKAGDPIPSLFSVWWDPPESYQLVKLHFEGVAAGALREPAGFGPGDPPGIISSTRLSSHKGTPATWQGMTAGRWNSWSCAAPDAEGSIQSLWLSRPDEMPPSCAPGRCAMG